MSRLSDLYKAMETLRKEGLSLNEDLERQVSELEENIIKKEIAACADKSLELIAVVKELVRLLVAVDLAAVAVAGLFGHAGSV